MCHARAYEWLKKKKSKGGKDPQTLTKHLLWARSCCTFGEEGNGDQSITQPASRRSVAPSLLGDGKGECPWGPIPSLS